MYHGDLIDSDDTGSDSSEPSLPAAKRRKGKGNKGNNQLTWAEAAKIVSVFYCFIWNNEIGRMFLP